MEVKQLYQLRQENLQKALNRQEPDFVPTMLYNHDASLAWAGKTVADVIHDPVAYVEALTAFCADVWFDATLMCGNPLGATPRLVEALEHPVNSIGPDGITPIHLQRVSMEADEYPLLIEDFNKFVSEVALPRMHPQLYEDREKTKRMLKVYAEERFRLMVQSAGMIQQTLAEKYGIPNALCTQQIGCMTNPLDVIFDNFRGFRGTLTDLRRQPENVKKAVETAWQVRCLPNMAQPYDPNRGWSAHMPHIPAYLSPKQFDELYWPYMKQQYEHIFASGGKVFVCLEGRWEHIWHHFLELPKDSVILNIDDDDIFKANKELGHHQILCGGLKVADTKLKTFDQIKDDVKRVIDECASGGGFLFCTDKTWLSPGDVNQTMIDAYNFAHEYSKK